MVARRNQRLVSAIFWIARSYAVSIRKRGYIASAEPDYERSDFIRAPLLLERGKISLDRARPRLHGE
jgi:hypothetical protein